MSIGIVSRSLNNLIGQSRRTLTGCFITDIVNWSKSMNNWLTVAVCPRFVFAVSCLFVYLNPLHSQWVQTNGLSGGYVHSIISTGTNLFAGTDGGVFLSIDNGTSWTAVNSGLSSPYVLSMAAVGTNLFAGFNGGGINLSTNNGSSWKPINVGLTGTQVLALATSPTGTNLFAGTDKGIYLTTNNGTSWSDASAGLTNLNVYAVGVSVTATGGTNIFAGTNGGGVFLSTNNGANWAEVNSGLTDLHVWSFAVIGHNVFASTNKGVFLYSNSGKNWTAVNSGISSTQVLTIAAVTSAHGSSTTLFAGTNGGVYLSTDNGTSWSTANTGLPNVIVRSVAAIGSSFYAGTLGMGIWKRPLVEMYTSVDGPLTDVPNLFVLCQNYPNPFNPGTSFEFRISSLGFVSLKIFDVLGREVATLVNEVRPAGVHTIRWDAASLPSGVYYYRLRAGAFVEAKKMVLMK